MLIEEKHKNNVLLIIIGKERHAKQINSISSYIETFGKENDQYVNYIFNNSISFLIGSSVLYVSAIPDLKEVNEIVAFIQSSFPNVKFGEIYSTFQEEPFNQQQLMSIADCLDSVIHLDLIEG